MCVVAELCSNKGSALVVAYPAEASVRADPTLEAAGLSNLVALEQHGPDENPQTDSRKERSAHSWSYLHIVTLLLVLKYLLRRLRAVRIRCRTRYSNARV